MVLRGCVCLYAGHPVRRATSHRLCRRGGWTGGRVAPRHAVLCRIAVCLVRSVLRLVSLRHTNSVLNIMSHTSLWPSVLNGRVALRRTGPPRHRFTAQTDRQAWYETARQAWCYIPHRAGLNPPGTSSPTRSTSSRALPWPPSPGPRPGTSGWWPSPAGSIGTMAGRGDGTCFILLTLTLNKRCT